MPGAKTGSGLTRATDEPFASGHKTGQTVLSLSQEAVMAIREQSSSSIIDHAFEIMPQAKIAEALGVDARTVRRWKTGATEAPRHIMLALERLLQDRPTDTSFTFIDLFAGIGGTRLGFEQAGGRCVFTSEWNKFSKQTYLENFGTGSGHTFEGDITKVDACDVPDHDVLVAGFPCQPFSIAGVSKKNSLGRKHGFEDETQGTLFFDVARIIDEKRPRAFMLENVKNLQSHDRGRTFDTIIRVLRDELEYDIDYRIVDASPWVPQGRRRIFIVGFRPDIDHTFDFHDLTIPERHPVMADILHPEDGTEAPEPPFTQGPHASVNPKYTLTDNLWRYLQEYARKHKAAGNGFGYGLVGPDSVARTLSARYHKDGSEILVSRGEGRTPRRLTPRECGRLMGFDDDFKIPVSDTQAYRQFGNSVVVPVIEAIAKLMAGSADLARGSD